MLDEFRSYDINFDDRLDPYEFYQVLQELKTDDSIVDPNRVRDVLIYIATLTNTAVHTV